ncbi:MAG: type I secretion C-terminal target domain-containing protein [Kiloniellales bacterium]
MGKIGFLPGEVAGLLADNQNEPRLVEPHLELPQAAPVIPADATIAFSNPNGGDVLDLGDVLMGQPGSNNIDLYLRAISHGESSILLVDTGGTGNFANPDLVLEIGGVDWDSSVAGQIAGLVDDSIILV